MAEIRITVRKLTGGWPRYSGAGKKLPSPKCERKLRKADGHRILVSFPNYFQSLVVTAILVLAPAISAQEPSADRVNPEVPRGAPEPEHKRILGIIPNYRTSPSLVNYQPLSAKEKFKIATQDSFDRGTVILAALFAGEGQLTNSNPSFGQGAAGFARYFGTSYGDFLIGNYMTEAVFPTLLHQDPRYFRKGTGGGWSRVRYAIRQLFITQTDAGGRAFNFSEVGGNSAAVAISMAYYPDNRDVSSGVSKLGIQLGVDGASNILKEFWPDIDRKFFQRKRQHD
jgi:hypothetical protein